MFITGQTSIMLHGLPDATATGFLFVGKSPLQHVHSCTGRLLVFVGFRQPVIILQVSFSVASSFFAWVERSHTGQAYSAAELHSARADDLSVVGVAPHFEVLSLRCKHL